MYKKNQVLQLTDHLRLVQKLTNKTRDKQSSSIYKKNQVMPSYICQISQFKLYDCVS
jgi:hypothetical protein